MSMDFALMLAKEFLWTAILLSAPILILSMLVGLAISVVQVVTQIQEMSLTFVPKIITVALALIAFGPWMLGLLVQFSQGMIANIPLYF